MPRHQGLRISELIGLCASDVHLGSGAHLLCHGKGRKERATPLTPTMAIKILRHWLTEQQPAPTSRLFPTRTGTALSRDAIERYRAARHGQKTLTPVLGSGVGAPGEARALGMIR